jgi:hypothetical protein
MDEYFKNPFVRARILEFLGGVPPSSVTSVFLARCDAAEYSEVVAQSPDDLDGFLDRGLDIARSLWDRRFLVVHLDIEYVNFDSPVEPYLNPGRSFELQEPVARAVQKILLEYGIQPLHLLTGRGHHFVWQIERESDVFHRLASFGRVPDSLRAIYVKPHPPMGEPVPRMVGQAFAGLALVMEFLAHRIKEMSAPLARVPVELTAVEVGPSERGREMISIDISEYGDPLHTRMVRIPFTVYRKHWETGYAAEARVEDQIRLMIMIPLHEMDARQAISLMQNPQEVLALAERASVQIPVQSGAMETLVDAYEQSKLRDFHDWYYAHDHEPKEIWPKTYDCTPMDAITPCVRHILEHPNDLLLKPAGIQMVVRTMMALGWHPRHVAGLIRSKFERDFGWNTHWLHYDPGTRADFYTRVFAGLFVVGLDDLVDFNSLSTREKGYCFRPELPCSIDELRGSLLERRNHDRLACGPFNRLFLPAAHL